MAKILVISDDVTVQIVLQDLQSREGHEVAIASDGREGLERAQTLVPDLIISDGMMPQASGWEVCRQVKANPELAATFFILLMAPEELSHHQKDLSAGIDDFLSKPIELQELLVRVRGGLRWRELRQQCDRAQQDLQQTQAQLVQSEKRASLGVLVQGIAHEINNPITFIYSNLIHIQNYTSDLIDLLQLYQKSSTNPSPEILQKQQEIELEFVLGDLFKILNSMRTGSDRIREIVQSLQEFSRTDRSGWQPFDINASLDNTLLMLQNRLPAREGRSDIKVIKNYGELPPVECYAGQLNQAFLNVLNNAIDAIEASATQHSQEELEAEKLKPLIQIRTAVLDNNRVSIQIIDNGVGMSQDVRARIFEPFFTTKPVGEGIGLGLSISFQVVMQHQGELRCASELGKGTEFDIQIPIMHCNFISA